MAKQYGMVIDTTRCMGCQTCVVACKVSNEVPGDIYWAHVEGLDGDVYGRAGLHAPGTMIVVLAVEAHRALRGHRGLLVDLRHAVGAGLGGGWSRRKEAVPFEVPCTRGAP